jgi:hypothetical protein
MNWESLSQKDLYWFCVKRSKGYQSDLQQFVDEILPLIKHYEPSRISKISKRHGELIDFSSADEEVFCHAPSGVIAHDRGQDLLLINNSVLGFLARWRVLPTRTDAQVAPHIDPLPKDIGDGGIFGDQDFITIKIDPLNPFSDLHELLKERVVSSRSKMLKAARALGGPYKAMESLVGLSNRLDRKTKQMMTWDAAVMGLRVLECWEEVNGVLALGSFDSDAKMLKKRTWPTDIKKRLRKINPHIDSNSHSNLNKYLVRYAVPLIRFPKIILHLDMPES